MRNLFLTLVLANLLLLAWQFWVDPTPPVPSVSEPGDLVLFDTKSGSPSAVGRPGAVSAVGVPPGSVPGSPAGPCLRVGPLPDAAAAQQDSQRLAARGIDAVPIAQDGQLWLGHWVQIGGFASVPVAEVARQRLIAGGLVDAYLMQDEADPMISLGVFRDRGRADRVAADARTLGFKVIIRDRYRPAVEQWLLIRPRPGQGSILADLKLAGDRIMRTESAPCEAADGLGAPGNQLTVPGEPP